MHKQVISFIQISKIRTFFISLGAGELKPDYVVNNIKKKTQSYLESKSFVTAGLGKKRGGKRIRMESRENMS